MHSLEKSGISFVKRHIVLFAVIFSTIGTMYIRYCYRDFISYDMKLFLLEWFDEIKNGGGLLALRNPVGNYNIPYQTLIALLTYLPFRPEYMYKGLSIVFDYLMAWATSWLVYELTKKRSIQAIVYIVVSGLPVVVLNSAAWGQCDSIYTFFCVLSICFLLREKYLLCFIAYSVAFAFKLQAIFLLPFYLFIWLYQERFSLLHFFLIPLVDFVLCLPGVIAGQGISAFINPYIGQVEQSNKIYRNYPSFWCFLLEGKKNRDNQLGRILAIMTVILILVCIVVILLKKGPSLTQDRLIELAFMFVYTCVLFLPSMHERYSYLYMVLGVAVAVLDIKTLPAYMGLLLVDLQTYGRYLFGTDLAFWILLVALNLAIYLFYFFHLLVPMLHTPATIRGMSCISGLDG